MTTNVLKVTLAALLLAGPASVALAEVHPNAPTFSKLGNGHFIPNNLSDNGLWAVTETGDETHSDGGIILDMTTGKTIAMKTPAGTTNAGAVDITDDGNIVVGEYNGKCAYYTVSTQTWTQLDHSARGPQGQTGYGRLVNVTPDGRYACGVIQFDEMGTSAPVLYDLTTGKEIETPGLPTVNNFNNTPDQHWFRAISADGRYIYGCIDQIYFHECSHYIYDRETGKVQHMGFKPTETVVPGKRYYPQVDGLYFVDDAMMSPNGKWMTGIAYMVKPVEGSEWPQEYRSTIIYDVEKDQTTVIDTFGESNYGGGVVDNDGNVLSFLADGNPYPDAAVPLGDYYYPLTRVMSEGYGLDLYEASGLDVDGRPMCITADGKTIVMVITGTGDSYVMHLKEPLQEGAKRVNLLDHYSATPAGGSSLSYMAPVNVKFLYDIKVAGKANSVKLTDPEGNTVATCVGVAVDDSKKGIDLSFRPIQLTNGVTYTLTLPAGLVAMKENEDMLSPEIKVAYQGRMVAPVKVVAATPGDGSAVGVIDQNSNPILLTFDSNVKLANPQAARLYKNDETEPMATLMGAASGNQVLLYSGASLTLFDGNEYRVVLPAGAVTDIVGSNPNEEFTLHYTGNYIHKIESTDKILYQTKCENYLDMMFYEGDHRTPASKPAGWNFTKDTTPWLIMQDQDATTGEINLVLASHSMYTDRGASDDFMSLPQLFIPDENCFLQFQAQGYNPTKQDVLKVYILADEDRYNDNVIPENMLAKVRELTPVYDKAVSPGATQDDLVGEWTDVTIDLKEYAGKHVYIVFHNANENQSFLFLDNISVEHNMKYMVTVTSPTVVVGQNEAEISGTIISDNALQTYRNLSMELLDAQGTRVSSLTASDINLEQGQNYNFTFPDRLPVTVGEENPFTISVTMDGDVSATTGTIRNQAFAPFKRVLVEEFSGTNCGNCPRGFVAMENLQNMYGYAIQPVVYRTYQGSSESPGVGEITQYLGLDAVGAPSGVVNRTFMPSYPMGAVEGSHYVFSGRSIGDADTWLDNVQDALATPAEAVVHVKSAYDEATREIDMTATVSYAVNTRNKSVSLYMALLEDKVSIVQSNYLNSTEDPLLGDWGKGGKYGTAMVVGYELDHVARGIVGNGYQGEQIQLPAEVEAGKEYQFSYQFTVPEYVTEPKNASILVALIDTNTGNVINCNSAPFGADSTGIESLPAEGQDEGNIGIAAMGDGIIAIAANGAVEARAYDLAGQLIASGAGTDALNLSTGAFRGIAIVRATAADGSRACKLIVR